MQKVMKALQDLGYKMQLRTFGDKTRRLSLLNWCSEALPDYIPTCFGTANATVTSAVLVLTLTYSGLFDISNLEARLELCMIMSNSIPHTTP